MCFLKVSKFKKQIRLYNKHEQSSTAVKPETDNEIRCDSCTTAGHLEIQKG